MAFAIVTILSYFLGHCSRYLLESDSTGHVNDKQLITLQLTEQATLVCFEQYILATLPIDFITQHQLQAGMMLQCTIDGINEQAYSNRETPQVYNLTFVKQASKAVTIYCILYC